MGSDGGIRRDGTDLVLSIRVVPGAAREDISAGEGFIRVRVHAPPQDNQANKRVIRLLAKAFGVPPSDVLLERGQAARSKVVRVRTPARLPDFVHI